MAQSVKTYECEDCGMTGPHFCTGGQSPREGWVYSVTKEDIQTRMKKKRDRERQKRLYDEAKTCETTTESSSP